MQTIDDGGLLIGAVTKHHERPARSVDVGVTDQGARAVQRMLRACAECVIAHLSTELSAIARVMLDATRVHRVCK